MKNNQSELDALTDRIMQMIYEHKNITVPEDNDEILASDIYEALERYTRVKNDI